MEVSPAHSICVLSTESLSVNPCLDRVSAAHGNFSRQKLLEPLVLLGHYNSLSFLTIFMRARRRLFEAIIYINRVASEYGSDRSEPHFLRFKRLYLRCIKSNYNKVFI